MEDATLLKIALVGCIVGLTALFAVAQSIEPNEIGATLDQHEPNDVVKVEGIVTNIVAQGKATHLEIEVHNMINVVSFDRILQPLEKGMKIKITGKVNSYKDQKEIIADEIKKI